MKWLLKVVISLATLSTIVAAQVEVKYPCFNLPDSAIYTIQLGESFTLPLCVQSVLSNFRAKSVHLDGFDVSVKAFYLGSDCPTDLTSAKALEPVNQESSASWFQRTSLREPRYFSYDVERRIYVEKSGYLDEHTGDILLGEKPLRAYSVEQRLREVNIRSMVRMEMNDVIDLGGFYFVSTMPGLYRVQMDLFRHQGKKNGNNSKGEETVASRDLHLFFQCPPNLPELELAGSNTIQLHQIAYEYIHMPVINSIFFEKDEPLVFAQNKTDRFFRSLLFGRIVTKMACPHSNLQLHVFPDPLEQGHTNQDKASTLALSKKRALTIQSHLVELQQRYLVEHSCRLDPVEPASESLSDTSDCGLSFDVKSQDLDSRLARLLIKSEDSFNEREKYREENRVVAVGIDGEEEWRLFEPFAIKQNELPDYLTFHARLDSSGDIATSCLESASVIVRHRMSGDSVVRQLTNDELKSLRSNDLTLTWGSISLMNLISSPGEYEATLALQSKCDKGVQYSAPLTFRVQMKTVFFDEILALSPFDRAQFTNPYDENRIPTIAENILDNIESELDRLSPGDTIEAALFISGHTDILSEHRGPFYNLGLSFERAHFVRDMLGETVAGLAKKKEFEFDTEKLDFDTTATYFVSHELREKMRSPFYAKPSTQKLFQSIKSTDQKSEILEHFFKSMMSQKLRHLRLDPQLGSISKDTVRLNKIVTGEIDRVEQDIPAGIASLVLRKDQKLVRLRFVTAGFGAAIPFFRRMELTPGLKRVFCAGGIELDDTPSQIFADDKYPAGRVMNRRIEINLWIEEMSNANPSDKLQKS